MTAAHDSTLGIGESHSTAILVLSGKHGRLANVLGTIATEIATEIVIEIAKESGRGTEMQHDLGSETTIAMRVK